MEKINYNKFKFLEIERFVNLCCQNILGIDLLTENSINILRQILSYDSDFLSSCMFEPLEKKDEIVGVINIRGITQEELCIMNKIVIQVGHFFDAYSSFGSLTLDEMGYAYEGLEKSKKYSKEELQFFKIFIDSRRKKVNELYNRSTNLESAIMEMDFEEVKKLKTLLGFDKKPIYLHFTDFSDFKKIAEDYIYDLTFEEKQFDLLIDKYLEKKQIKKESDDGFSFCNMIKQEFSMYFDYERYLSDVKRLESKRRSWILANKYENRNSHNELISEDDVDFNSLKKDIDNLRKLLDNLCDSFVKFTSDISLIDDMMSLDEMINYRNGLDENLFWLKKAITDVIQKINKRIINFNSQVALGNISEILKDMSLFQKYQLLFFREHPYSENYSQSNELVNFTYDAANALWNSIKEDELMEAKENGFNNFDEYVLSLYENDIKDEDIVDIRKIYIINYYKNKISREKNNDKRL